MKPRKRLTDKVLRGIRAACSAGLAGPVGDGGDFTEQDGDDMEAALAWANGQDVQTVEATKLAELRAERDRMQPVVEAAVAWENRREREPYAPLTQAVFDYLSPDSKEGA